jgi:uncharacterized protein
VIVAVAIFELHIEHAQSLKEKRMVVKSLRDRLRSRFEISAAEVGMQELHQRARLAISFVALDDPAADAQLERIVTFVESNTDARLNGWTSEKLSFDEDVALGVPGIEE